MINKTFIFVVLGLSVITLFSSCKKNREVMSRGKMEAVLYDMQLAQSVYDNKRREFDSDEKKKALFDAVLEKHGITQAKLDSSLVHYADDMKMFLRMNDSIASELRKEKTVWNQKLEAQNLLNKRYDDRKLFASYYYLTATEPTYSFKLDSVNSNNINIASLENITFRVLGDPDTLFSSIRLQYADTSFVLPFVADDESPVYRVDILPFDTVEHTLEGLSGYIHVRSSYPNFNVLIHDIHFAAKDTLEVKTDSMAVSDRNRRVLKKLENIDRDE